jgi:hypothetical protein
MQKSTAIAANETEYLRTIVNHFYKFLGVRDERMYDYLGNRRVDPERPTLTRVFFSGRDRCLTNDLRVMRSVLFVHTMLLGPPPSSGIFLYRVFCGLDHAWPAKTG